MAARRSAWWKYALALSALLLLGCLVGAHAFLRASLPQLDGEVRATGLTSPVTVTRDALGVPTISGNTRQDVAYATGYLHAQDRFFQMDLLRRAAAGELAALIGPAALPLDRSRRLHRFRAQADALLPTLPPADRALLDRYTAGVNAGLAALHARPFEYALLRQVPDPWRASDSLLVIWAMYFDLQGNLGRKLIRGWLADHSSPAQRDFLLPQASDWDAPLDAAHIDLPTPPIPATAPDWFHHTAPSLAQADLDEAINAVGSNNWALAGSRTEHGAAIVAGDMHLGLRLPHIWYRAMLQYRQPNGQPRRLVGVTLPGAPALVAGSNGHVAWTLTNSYGDYLDLIDLQRDPQNPQRFRTERGWETMTRHDEHIAINGSRDEILSVYDTRFGPVWQVGGHAYALHWVAHEVGAVNLELAGLESCDNVACTQTVANQAGVPAQNLIAGDAAGHIGWTIAGPLPARDWQFAASFPYPSTDTTLGWTQLRAPADYPRIIDPRFGQLWTANNRQLASAPYARLGDGGADLGARARQIRDDLTQLGNTNEQAAYRIAFDDRALFMSQWRTRALAALDTVALVNHPQRAQFRNLLQNSWDGHASVTSVGYRLAHAYRGALYDKLFGGLDDLLTHELGDEMTYAKANGRWDIVLGRLEDAKPVGWLPTGYADWHALDLAAIDQAITKLTHDGQSLAAATWGQRNTAHIVHPFVHFLPFLKQWLAAPADSLSGDHNMPRVAGPDFGQSERMVVAPGHEELGIFNMPGGESGHPLSPYFLAGHEAWVRGDPTPLLPGPAQHTLHFVPN